MVFVVLFGVQTYPAGQTTDEVSALGVQTYPVGHRTAVPMFVLSVAAWTTGIDVVPKITTAAIIRVMVMREIVVDFILIKIINKSLLKFYALMFRIWHIHIISDSH
jgi:hypothetical protein